MVLHQISKLNIIFLLTIQRVMLWFLLLLLSNDIFVVCPHLHLTWNILANILYFCAVWVCVSLGTVSYTSYHDNIMQIYPKIPQSIVTFSGGSISRSIYLKHALHARFHSDLLLCVRLIWSTDICFCLTSSEKFIRLYTK